METKAERKGRFVQTAPVNRAEEFERTGGIMVYLSDADLRACGVDPDVTDYVGVRITESGGLSLYEARHAADDRA